MAGFLPNDPRFKLYNDYAINETVDGRRPLTPEAWLKMLELTKQKHNQDNQGSDSQGPGISLRQGV